jgi:hypothetical protein
MDNFGWGNGYNTATLTSDWNWDNFSSSISGSKVVITVTNNGNNTADILYNVTYINGKELVDSQPFQYRLNEDEQPIEQPEPQAKKRPAFLSVVKND